MTIQRRQFLRIFGAVPAIVPLFGTVSLAALAGCSSPNPNYYRLGVASGPTVSHGPPSVEVRSISIPGYLDRQGVVKSAGDFKLDIHSNDIWAEPFADMLQATLVQDLTQRMPGTSVIGSGGSIGASPNLIVETNVLRFDPNPDGTMTLQMQVAVRSGETLQIIVTRTIQESGPANEPVVANIVASMSTLWGAAASDIAHLLARTWDHLPLGSGG
ncbi:PqiC family protein [Acidisoma sp.]|uniref:PqiC family protein n=1 Tax=Acidisoma sp. TaxID=1872115 RepID=UPI003B0041BE